MLLDHHFQNAYVTNNLEKSLANFREHADIRMEYTVEADVVVSTPTGPQQNHNKIAFVWVGDLQYELIQPMGAGIGDIYREAMPAEDGALGFHHICMRVLDWDKFRAEVDRQSFPIMFEGDSGPLRYLYLNSKPVLGHYLEYIYMPEEIWAATGGQ